MKLGVASKNPVSKYGGWLPQPEYVLVTTFEVPDSEDAKNVVPAGAELQKILFFSEANAPPRKVAPAKTLLAMGSPLPSLPAAILLTVSAEEYLYLASFVTPIGEPELQDPVVYCEITMLFLITKLSATP